jgi:hypothetical protein
MTVARTSRRLGKIAWQVAVGPMPKVLTGSYAGSGTCAKLSMRYHFVRGIVCLPTTVSTPVVYPKWHDVTAAAAMA